MKTPTIRRFLNLAYKTRGKFLNIQINLELLIASYIAKYYCPDENKQDELRRMIIYPMRFKDKVESLKFIVVNYDKPFYNKNKAIFSDLGKIVEVRNILAHQMLDVTKYGEMDGELKSHFVKHAKEFKRMPYTQKEIESLIKKMGKYAAAIFYRLRK